MVATMIKDTLLDYLWEAIDRATAADCYHEADRVTLHALALSVALSALERAIEDKVSLARSS
jgi:hypothetical protein